MHSYYSYASVLRFVAGTPSNRARRALNLRDLERLTGYSYEHVRKVWTGMVVMSRELNDKLCAVLGLDAEVMWGLAAAERVACSRYRYVAATSILLTSWQPQRCKGHSVVSRFIVVS